MEMIGMLLFLVGGAMMLIGGLWLLVVTFQESVLWGLGSLFIPFVSLVFVVMHWEVAKQPFLLNIAGLVPVMIGMMLSGGGGA